MKKFREQLNEVLDFIKNLTPIGLNEAEKEIFETIENMKKED